MHGTEGNPKVLVQTVGKVICGELVITEEGVRRPQGHEEVQAVPSQKLLLMEQTDTVLLLQIPGPSVGRSHIVNILSICGQIELLLEVHDRHNRGVTCAPEVTGH